MTATYDTDVLAALAKGTDAGLYRLIPQRVATAPDEEAVRTLMAEAVKTGKPLTFKASGTSLSGQAVTDSVLVETGSGFGIPRIEAKGLYATFPCHLTGAEANRLLKRYGRKLGPAPGSIRAARIGGIVANNASGAGHGILHNAYHTVRSMRVILADGTVLDTGSEASRRLFFETHTSLLERLMNLRMEILCDEEMTARILHKYELKNTCGYGINALLDFEDPYDMLVHLMVGSEGTLGFISQVTFETIPDPAYKAAALVYFPDLKEACRAMPVLRSCGVSAAEWMDGRALRAVSGVPDMPAVLAALPPEAVAVLVEAASSDETLLQQKICSLEKHLSALHTLYPPVFTSDPATCAAYWQVQSDLFAAAAAARPRGRAWAIEDVAFREEVLVDALAAVRGLLRESGYGEAVMWGHLLDGNVHFTFFPDLGCPQGVERYAGFMRRLVDLVLQYDGSLKGEQGTGRRMAPFVEKEWGGKIYRWMKEIKRLFDPENILNPGVILNEDPEVFIRNFKQMPVAGEEIDGCIECGFCENLCLSRHLTLTPRQRIVAYRTLVSMQAAGEEASSRYRALEKAFRYAGSATCATEGLCAADCPAGIDTGALIKKLRWQNHTAPAHKLAFCAARHFNRLTAVLPPLLSFFQGLARIVGYKPAEVCWQTLFRLSGRRLPLWTRHTPGGARRLRFQSETAVAGQAEMVYFPSCVARTLGASADYEERTGVTEKTIELLHRAGFAIRYPEDTRRLCCGRAFSNKGFRKQAALKEAELNAALLSASDGGRLPILCDTSPCLLHMRQTLDKRLRLYEPVGFITTYMLDKLVFRRLPVTVAVHATCSDMKMGLAGALEALASRCAQGVVSPAGITCCGWGGDRGFFYPELNRSALQTLQTGLAGATEGYSNSRTCEIGLTRESGVSYKSIVFLVEKATGPQGS